MYLHSPTEPAETSRLYQRDREQGGFVMNLTRAWAWRPDVCESFASLRSLLTTHSSLSQRELVVLVCATAASLGDSYCALAWGTRLAAQADASSAAAVLNATRAGALTGREHSLAVWARKAVADPNATRLDDVDALREAGLSEREIFEATVFIALRLAFSTVNDALGVEPDRQLADAAPPEVRRAVGFGRAPAPS